MTDVDVTAATVKRVFLEPGLDARALNLAQTTLLLDPSPERDSIVERLDELRGKVPTSTAVAELAAAAHSLLASNRQEGKCETKITGAADRLARDLRDLELNHRGHQVLTARAIARRLREPLRLIARPAGAPAKQLVEAGRVVGELIARCPQDQLLSPAVQYDLGSYRFELLRKLTERAP